MPNEYGHLSDTEIRAEALRAAVKLVALNPQGLDSLNLDRTLLVARALETYILEGS